MLIKQKEEKTKVRQNKTTVLHMVKGAQKATSGFLWLDQEDPRKIRVKDRFIFTASEFSLSIKLHVE